MRLVTHVENRVKGFDPTATRLPMRPALTLEKVHRYPRAAEENGWFITALYAHVTEIIAAWAKGLRHIVVANNHVLPTW